MADFNYDSAFVRNLGWLTLAEQRRLRRKCVAIAGLGGVGGHHLLTLARLGVGTFHLADFDRFDIANMNRQAGAFASTLGRPKAAVMEAMARDVNPTVRIHRLDEGLRDDADIDAFLEGADLFVDGLDFFVLDIRRKVYAAARACGIPVISAAPLGHGVAWLTFLPDGMSFEDYFRLEGENEQRQYVKFMVGLAPKALHRRALIDPSRVDFAARAGPSTAMACQMAGAIVGTEAVKILLRRGGVRAAPAWQQFDPYRGRHAHGRLPGGNAHPWRRLKIALAERWIRRIAPRSDPYADSAGPQATPIERILDLARWAPSGDNDQPWRFEILGEDRVRVHMQYEPGTNIYEYAGGRPVWIAVGGLLETVRIAASEYGMTCGWEIDAADPKRIDVTFAAMSGMPLDPLAEFIKTRSVDRRSYRRTPLTAEDKAALEEAWGPAFAIRWFETRAEKWAATRLNMRATRLRLSIPECHRVHQKVIRFDTDHAADGIPAAAVGLDALTTRLMRWANARFWRTDLLNHRLGGAWLASLELDLFPGMSCAAHFVVRWRETGERPITDWLAAGAAMQRFWLTAESRGLVLQPGFAPVIFAHHAVARSTWERPKTRAKAERLALRLQETLGTDAEAVAFLGRIGLPQGLPPARSVRRPLEVLIDGSSRETD